MSKHPLSFLGGVLIGVTAMYFLDGQSGRSRRTLVRDKVASRGREAARFAQGQGQRVLDKARGMTAGRSLPRSDSQLHERIRSRLGHVLSHPRAVHVVVDRGTVNLSGGVLRDEMEMLCREVESMPGVTLVRNELQAHDSSESLLELQAREELPPLGQPTGAAVH